MINSLWRKVIYCVAIAGLLYPLFLIGQKESGGKLGELRNKYRLSTADLGKIDPAGESMKLASLGLRGVATTMLWERAQEFKKKDNFDALSETCKQITRLQPNFLKVWEFQAHNLAYNVSVEFDDYRHRYSWVRKGIEFLMEGTEYNRSEPRLLYFVGWYVGQKIGRADERVQFRRMFRTDEEFHASMEPHVEKIGLPESLGPDSYPDNWLVGRLWFEKSHNSVNEGNPIKGTSPLIFYAQKAMSRINFSESIATEGTFGEAGLSAWRSANEDWQEYGAMEIPSTWGEPVILEEGESLSEKIRERRKELDELTRNVRERLGAERLSELTEIERKAWETPAEDRYAWGTREWRRYETAQKKLEVTDTDVANAAPSEVLAQARSIAKSIGDLQTRRERCRRYRSIMNYTYWRERCLVEQTELAVSARENLFVAEEAMGKADLGLAKERYEAAWKQWEEIFAKYPGIRIDLSARDLEDPMKNYQWTLLQLEGEGIPSDFPLGWVLNPDALPKAGPYNDAAAEQLEKARLEKEAKEQAAKDAPKDDASAKEDASKERPAADAPAKEDMKKEQPAKEEAKEAPKDEPAKEQPKGDASQDDDPAKKDMKKEEQAKEEAKEAPKDEPAKEQPKDDASQGDAPAKKDMKKEEQAKEEAKEAPKDEPAKEQPKDDASQGDAPAKKDMKKEEQAKEEAKEAPKDEPAKEQPKDDGSQGDAPAKKDMKKEEQAKEEAKEAPKAKESPRTTLAKDMKKEEPAKEEAKEAPKDEPAKEQPKDDASQGDAPAKKDMKKEEQAKEEAKEAPKDEPAKEQPKDDASQGDAPAKRGHEERGAGEGRSQRGS